MNVFGTCFSVGTGAHLNVFTNGLLIPVVRAITETKINTGFTCTFTTILRFNSEGCKVH